MSETPTPEEEPAHDILAAEAFAVPAPDPALQHAPVVLPDDPTGIAEPHDILAAEEFAMPAVRQSPLTRALRAGNGQLPRRLARRLAIATFAGVLALRLLRRR